MLLSQSVCRLSHNIPTYYIVRRHGKALLLGTRPNKQCAASRCRKTVPACGSRHTLIFRVVLRCRQLAREKFARLRSDVLVKLELLDNKHGNILFFVRNILLS